MTNLNKGVKGRLDPRSLTQDPYNIQRWEQDMTKPTTTIPISSIILDEDIYPRKSIDSRRIGIFAENIRDGFKFDPIEVEPAPGKPGMYRLLALNSGDSIPVFRRKKSITCMLSSDYPIFQGAGSHDPAHVLYFDRKAVGRQPLT